MKIKNTKLEHRRRCGESQTVIAYLSCRFLPPHHHPHTAHCSEQLCHCRQLYAAPSICGSPATASEAAPSPELHTNAAGDAAFIHPAYHPALDLVDAPLHHFRHPLSVYLVSRPPTTRLLLFLPRHSTSPHLLPSRHLEHIVLPTEFVHLTIRHSLSLYSPRLFSPSTTPPEQQQAGVPPRLRRLHPVCTHTRAPFAHIAVESSLAS